MTFGGGPPRSGWTVGAPDWGGGAAGGDGDGDPSCIVKFTVTVMITGTARPSITVGANSHWRTAATAAASSGGTERTTLALLTLPSASIVASSTTTPCARAACASGGDVGLTSLILRGAGTSLPTWIGPAGMSTLTRVTP